MQTTEQLLAAAQAQAAMRQMFEPYTDEHAALWRVRNHRPARARRTRRAWRAWRAQVTPASPRRAGRALGGGEVCSRNSTAVGPLSAPTSTAGWSAS